MPHLKILVLKDVIWHCVGSSAIFHAGSRDQLILSFLIRMGSDVLWIKVLIVTLLVLKVLAVGKLLQPATKWNLQACLGTPLLLNGRKKPAVLGVFFSSFLFKIWPCCPIKWLWGLALKPMVFFTAPAAVSWQCFSIVQDKKSALIQACGKEIHSVNPHHIYCAPKGVATW